MFRIVFASVIGRSKSDLGDRYIGIGMSGGCTGLFEVRGMLTCLLVSKF